MNFVSVPFRHQRIRGHGLGGILSNLKHFVRSIFNKTKDILLKPLANEGIKLLSSTAKDVIQGKRPASALKENFDISKKRIVKKGKKVIAQKVKTKKGKKKSLGTGKKKKKSPSKKKKSNKKSKKSIFEDYM